MASEQQRIHSAVECPAQSAAHINSLSSSTCCETSAECCAASQSACTALCRCTARASLNASGPQSTIDSNEDFTSQDDGFLPCRGEEDRSYQCDDVANNEGLSCGQARELASRSPVTPHGLSTVTTCPGEVESNLLLSRLTSDTSPASSSVSVACLPVENSAPSLGEGFRPDGSGAHVQKSCSAANQQADCLPTTCQTLHTEDPPCRFSDSRSHACVCVSTETQASCPSVRLNESSTNLCNVSEVGVTRHQGISEDFSSLPSDTSEERCCLPSSLGTSGSLRPRSCSVASDSMLSYALMSPLLVASSPLARSSPSLPTCTGGPSNVPDAVAILRAHLRGSRQSLQPDHTDHLLAVVDTSSETHQKLNRNAPLSSPVNLFRRASLQPPRLTSVQVEGGSSCLSDDDDQSPHHHLFRSFRKSSVKSSVTAENYTPTFPASKSFSLKGSFALPEINKRSSGLSDIFKSRAAPLSPSTALPSVAIVPPLKGVSPVEADVRTLTRDSAPPEAQDSSSSAQSSADSSTRGGSGCGAALPRRKASRSGEALIPTATPAPSAPLPDVPLITTPSKRHLPPSPSSKHGSPVKTPGVVGKESDSGEASSRQTGCVVEAVVCPNQHTGREVFNKSYAIPIDDLFTLLFTNSKMMVEVHNSRRITDVQASPWQSKQDSLQRLRQVTYTVALPTNSFGPKVSHVTETQVMSEHTTPGQYYSIDAEASNAGIPYADSFMVSNHWCLTRESASESRLCVWTRVHYTKGVWGFMKGVIDKNACSGVESLLADIDVALQREAAQILSDTRQLARRHRRRRHGSSARGDAELGSAPISPSADTEELATSTVSRMLGAADAIVGLQSSAVPGSTSSAATASVTRGRGFSISTPFSKARQDGGINWGVRLLQVVLLLLLSTNVLLYYKLWQLETAFLASHSYDLETRSLFDLDPVLLKKNMGGPLGETWLQLLQEQDTAHARQQEAWRRQVSEAAALLSQAEGVLRGLHGTIPEQHSANMRELIDRVRSLYPHHPQHHCNDCGDARSCDCSDVRFCDGCGDTPSHYSSQFPTEYKMNSNNANAQDTMASNAS